MSDILRNTPIALLPNWLRWVLFLPLSAALTIVINNLLIFLQIALGFEKSEGVIILRLVIVMLVFIFSAALIAPKAQARIALIIGSVMSGMTLLFICLTAIITIAEGSTGALNIPMIILATVLIWGGSLFAYLTIRKLSKKSTKKR
jgi:hypothetical protein